MILRGPRQSDRFIQIHADALEDGTLSFKARGILAYLLSLPPGDEISAERLTKSGVDGERAVKSGLRELQDAGYLLPVEEGWTASDTKGADVPAPAVPVVPVDGAEQLMWLTTNHPWLSPAAVKTAHREIELQDLPLCITKYEIRMKELGKSPTSGEWLRWTIEDEQKLRTADRERARANGETSKWWSTASD